MRTLALTLAVATALLCAALWTHWLQPVPVEAPPATARHPKPRPALPLATVTQAAVNGNEARTPAASASRLEMVRELRQASTRALHSDDLYATFVRMWDARTQGGGAGSAALEEHCQLAWIWARSSAAGVMPTGDQARASRGPQPLPGADPALEAQRLEAYRRIDQRCDQITADALRGEGMRDDLYLQAKDQARNTHDFRAFAEVHLQFERYDAFLALFRAYANRVPWFEGQPYGGAGGPAPFNQALDIARVLLYADANNPSPHLYALALCAQKGACAGTLEDRLLVDFPPGKPERAAIQALYPRLMAAALRKDVDAFAIRPAQ